jgi:hypothetical protein
MSLAYYPNFEHLLEGFDPVTVFDGKALAKASDALMVIAKRLKVTSLEEFFGAVPELDDIDIEERWFNPEEGLKTVIALTDYLQQHPKVIPVQKAVIEDLQNLQKVLELAQQSNIRWHLAIDF